MFEGLPLLLIGNQKESHELTFAFLLPTMCVAVQILFYHYYIKKPSKC